MKRTVIEIDEEACDGCGLCVNACHEGAIGLVDGKARLLRDDFCDGMGDCLPACPQNAITFVEREAVAYDEAAVQAHKASQAAVNATAQVGSPATAAPAAAMSHAGGCPSARPQVLAGTSAGGCPGSRPQTFERDAAMGGCPGAKPQVLGEEAAASVVPGAVDCARHPSQLAQWPAEIKLVPIQAPYFAGAHVLVAADCTAFAYADFHCDFMAGRVTIIGCPKLDGVDYAEKLTAIFASNDIASVTVARMEVPCCGGLENAVRRALAACGKDIPLQVATISIRGELL